MVDESQTRLRRLMLRGLTEEKKESEERKENKEV
jgi:hypothetical protein